MSDIEIAYNLIKNKRPELDTPWAYANGEQPLRYSTNRLQEAFNDINAHFCNLDMHNKLVEVGQGWFI